MGQKRCFPCASNISCPAESLWNKMGICQREEVVNVFLNKSGKKIFNANAYSCPKAA